MITIYLDAVGGIAGDMFVAAMLDARPDLRNRVMADATAVLPREVGGIDLQETTNGGVQALRFGLTKAAHSHGSHEHAHHHGGDAGSFQDMVARIRTAPLHAGTADQAIGILTRIAEVEAAIHRVALDSVHFHEIADWDSLLDVVAAGSIAAALPTARWIVSALPRGGGLVPTSHGLLPVPAPATARLLTGFEWRDDGISGERVTPTGAAILHHLVGPDKFATAAGRLVAVGTGAGTRTLHGIPNVLRAMIFATSAALPSESISVISFDIDDMTGEEIAVASDRLRAVDGVLDLSVGLRLGKKGRSMHAFRLLVRPEATQVVAQHCLVETSTIGLRWREENRLVLHRRSERVTHEGVAVDRKVAMRPDGAETTKAENDSIIGADLAARRRLKRLAEDEAQP
jgi:uncharacterized protein (TIGR00299 family) protein